VLRSIKGLPQLAGNGMSAVNFGRCISTNEQKSLLHCKRNPLAMQHVGNVAIKPDLHSGQHACFSNDVFKVSSSKIPLVADGFDCLVGGGVSSESGSARDETSVALHDMSIRAGLSGLSADRDSSR